MKLTKMMYPQSGGRMTVKYPENRQLRINGNVTRELLANPDLYDSEGQPCLIVLKDGCTTDLTVGFYAGLESFLCDEDGVESIKFANRRPALSQPRETQAPLSSTASVAWLASSTLGCRKAARPVPTSRVLPLPASGGSWVASRQSIHTPTSTASPGKGEINAELAQLRGLGT